MPTDPPIPDRANGQTISQIWFNLLKTILYQFEDRILELEGEYVDFIFHCHSLLDHLALPKEGHIIHEIDQDLAVIDCEIIVFEAGSAGTVEIDVEYKRGGGAWTGVLSTNPTVAFGAGSLVSSSNGAVDPLNDELDAGDFIRLNIVQLQTGLRHWAVRLRCQKPAS